MIDKLVLYRFLDAIKQNWSDNDGNFSEDT